MYCRKFKVLCYKRVNLHTRKRKLLIMDKMFTDTGFEVTQLVKDEKTKFVETREEAIKLTERVGYFYTVLDDKKNIIGFGIPK